MPYAGQKVTPGLIQYYGDGLPLGLGRAGESSTSSDGRCGAAEDGRAREGGGKERDRNGSCEHECRDTRRLADEKILSQNRKHFIVNVYTAEDKAEEKTKEDTKARRKRMALVAPDIGKRHSSLETRKQENDETGKRGNSLRKTKVKRTGKARPGAVRKPFINFPIAVPSPRHPAATPSSLPCAPIYVHPRQRHVPVR